jgi:hypothetical protein
MEVGEAVRVELEAVLDGDQALVGRDLVDQSPQQGGLADKQNVTRHRKNSEKFVRTDWGRPGTGQDCQGARRPPHVQQYDADVLSRWRETRASISRRERR